MRVSLLLSALGALSLCMSDARSQQSGESSAEGAPATLRDSGRISLEPGVWTTAGARVPAIDLPLATGDLDGVLGDRRLEDLGSDVELSLEPDGPAPQGLYELVRTVDRKRPEGALPKRTLLIQFASW